MSLVASTIEMVYWPITKPIDYSRNPRKNDQVVAKMVASIHEFGFTIPILCRSDGLVIDGHLRLKAARELKMTEVPVVLADHLSEAQIKAFRLLANKSANWAEFDDGLLKLELLELKSMDFDLNLTGFEMKEIESIIKEGRDPIEEDETPETTEEPICQEGDLWLLGEHRVICGDCENPEVMERLLDGRVPDACVSDPPYGIDFDTDYTRFTIQRHKNNKHKPIQNDDHVFDPRPYLDYPSVVLFGANYFAEHLPTGTWLVWDKRFDNGKAWLSDAELAWMKGGTGVYIKSLTAQGFVRPDRDEKVSHPTQKPIELMAWCIEKCKAGNLILDPYLGSGTTLLAAHKLNKVCFGAEIEPSYVDVIVARYERLTGEKAKRG